MNINFNSFSFGLSGKLIIYKADRLVCEAGDLSPFSVVKYCAVVGPYLGFPAGSDGKETACQCRRQKRRQFDPWVRKIPWRKAWQPTPVFLPGEFHGQRTLTDYRVTKGQTRLKRLSTHTYLM